MGQVGQLLPYQFGPSWRPNILCWAPLIPLGKRSRRVANWPLPTPVAHVWPRPSRTLDAQAAGSHCATVIVCGSSSRHRLGEGIKRPTLDGPFLNAFVTGARKAPSRGADTETDPFEEASQAYLQPPLDDDAFSKAVKRIVQSATFRQAFMRLDMARRRAWVIRLT
ncbi:hypothetical protein CJ030_MR7G020463 [Morella rubra]|uniref:Uncharacterized protein n=1 Tax=Morella rubra TaxID=262757 RepID=A0A6A1V3I8_9ROSI|nr:hypothetical protein CJ030_MR7G020463 [Morella rubra]